MAFLNRWYHSQAGARCHPLRLAVRSPHPVVWQMHDAEWAERAQEALTFLTGKPLLLLAVPWGGEDPTLQQGEPSGRPTPHHYTRVIYLCDADFARVVTSPSAEEVFTILPCTQNNHFLSFSMQSICGAEDSVTDSSSYQTHMPSGACKLSQNKYCSVP